MTKAKTIMVVTGGLMILAVVLWGTNRVKATQPQVEYVSFGMVGVARGQTLRLNVVNAAVSDRRLPPDPCRVQLTLVDGAGTVIAQSFETLSSSQAAALDFSGGTTGLETNRTQVRAFVKVLSDARGNQLPPDPCIVSLEIFDNSTGRTVVLHPGTMMLQSLSVN